MLYSHWSHRAVCTYSVRTSITHHAVANIAEHSHGTAEFLFNQNSAPPSLIDIYKMNLISTGFIPLESTFNSRKRTKNMGSVICFCNLIILLYSSHTNTSCAIIFYYICYLLVLIFILILYKRKTTFVYL